MSRIFLQDSFKEFCEINKLEANKQQVKIIHSLEKFLNSTWDILLLDVMMPKKDGFSLAKDIRKVDKTVPIIFLTAKSQKDNVIKAFKLGADDYLTKPFSIEELLARIEAVMKRVPEKNQQELSDEFILGSYIYLHNQNLLIDKDLSLIHI